MRPRQRGRNATSGARSKSRSRAGGGGQQQQQHWRTQLEASRRGFDAVLPPPPSPEQAPPPTAASAAAAVPDTSDAAVLALVPRRVLWPHQRDGVAFMQERLRSPLVATDGTRIAGGFLCDDTRLGKCTTTAAFIVADLQERTQRGARLGQPTLIVCPTVAVAVWVNEIAAYLHGHGNSNCAPLRVRVVTSESVTAPLHAFDLAMGTDVIVTTYSAVAGLRRHGISQALQALHYRGLFCDEAHQLVNENTAVHAVFAEHMHADLKWFISASPLQNAASDLQSALRFVNVPAADMATPDQCRLLLRRLYLRRLRSDVAETMGLAAVPSVPEMRLAVVTLDFASPTEARLYGSMARAMEHVFVSTTSASATGERAARVPQTFAISVLHRLRQVCLSPYVVGYETLLRGDAVTGVPPLADGLVLCPSSSSSSPDMEDEETAARRLAGQAVAYYTLSGNDPTVLQPLMDALYARHGREAGDRISARAEALRDVIVPPLSTKEHWVCNTLLRERVDPAGEKVVIFCNWCIGLERLAHWLDVRHRVLRLPGAREHVYVYGGGAHDHTAAIARFCTDPAVGYLLITNKSGSESLDLSAANHVVLLDPWWNPHREQQAADRIEGVNQRRPTHCYRLAIRHTIDEEIVALANRKLRMHDSWLPPTSAAVAERQDLARIALAYRQHQHQESQESQEAPFSPMDTDGDT